MTFIYNIALVFGLSAFVPYTLWRFFTGKETTESLVQKFGFYRMPKPEKGGIWIHAVSVGEVNAAMPLVDSLMSREQEQPIIFSASTQTGMALAKNRLEGRATVTYFPFDFPSAVKRGYAHFSPAAVVLMETEIWPNFIRHSGNVGSRAILINGRISDRSFGRYRKIKSVIAPALLAFDVLLMQSENDARKIIELGANGANVRVTGNIKFDRPLPQPEDKAHVMERFGLPPETTVIIFASTHPGEDDMFLQTIKELSTRHPKLFPIIVPRHVERSPKLGQLCQKYGFNPVMRSGGGGHGKNPLLLVDTIGELAQLYGAADMAIIGGSFIPHGGQNPLEASSWEVPVIFGPHMENFRDISQRLTEAGAAVSANNIHDLKKTIEGWIADPEAKELAGRAGRQAVMDNRGALEKTVRSIAELLQ